MACLKCGTTLADPKRVLCDACLQSEIQPTTKPQNYIKQPVNITTQKLDDCWITSAQYIQVAGRPLRGGLFYYGQKLPSISAKHIPETALIIPGLPVAPSAKAKDIEMPYWPSYSTISPQARAIFLNWLATGRNDPDVNIGVVFLYFYGFERRLLFDAQTNPDAANDFVVIRDEVKRLLNIYSHSNSFWNYANSFLEIINNLYSDENANAISPPTAPINWALPFSLRRAVGKYAKLKMPIPWEWALSWYICHPETRLLTSA